MEKLTFTLVTTARKLKPYFQAHIVVVLIDKPLQRAMSNPEAAGRIAIWAIELSEFDIQYRPQTAIKGKVIVDFIAEFMNAYKTTVGIPAGETSFRLASGNEAVILAEVRLTSYRVGNYNSSKNDEAIRLQLDLVNEVKVTAKQRLAWYQDLMAKHYNSKVRNRDFQVGDLVLRKVTGATRDLAQGKLGPNWKGPYRITSWQRKGTYHLETLDRQKLRHP
ncbi:uncharacterized protein LOC142643975 [Castanea sativa]|uniref:uncharacterized protein LOC142643975 n=1 Tax=Castanea sativa TaxID=21020 RepID=UPI003F64BADD